MQASASSSPGGRKSSLLRPFSRSARGQSLVELAILLPVLLILALGVIDYGRVYFAYVSVTNAARNGAHYASESPAATADLDGIRNTALDDMSELLNTSPTNPVVSAVSDTDSKGRLYADVTVTYTFGTILPWPGLPTSFDVERTVRSRVAE